MIDLECLTLNAKNFGQFYFRTEVMSENLTSELFCSPNFLPSEIFVLQYLKIITYYFDSLNPKRQSYCPHHRRKCFLLIHADCVPLFQLLDSSSL